MMEQQGRGGESNFSRLFPYLEHPDFLIRCKAFLTLGRTGNADDGGPLLRIVERPWLPWAHLMVLDAYHGLPIPGPQRAAAFGPGGTPVAPYGPPGVLMGVGPYGRTSGFWLLRNFFYKPMLAGEQ